MHFGHLMAAQDVYEQHQLDRLILVPAAQAPLKPNDVQSSAEDRLAMLRSAVEWDRRFEISDLELRRGGVSYTIDSVRHFRALFPQDELYWIIGGDQLPKLHLWKEIGEGVNIEVKLKISSLEYANSFLTTDESIDTYSNPFK